MATGDYNVEPLKLDTDPRETICSCKSSKVLPPMPNIHCPKCHCTYAARTLQRPAYCAHCHYNLRKWRLRNSIADLIVQFA